MHTMNIGLIEGPSGVRSEGSGPVGNPALYKTSREEYIQMALFVYC